MEFEKNAPVSDEQRRLAESKKITVEPAHADITPDDISDSEIANQHINGQPLGNVNNDIEQNVPILHRSDEIQYPVESSTRKQSALMIIIIVGVATIVIAASLFIVLSLTK